MCPHFVLCQTDAKKMKLWTFLSKLSEHHFFLHFPAQRKYAYKVFQNNKQISVHQSYKWNIKIADLSTHNIKKTTSKPPKTKIYQNQLKNPSISGLSHCILNLTSEELKT